MAIAVTGVIVMITAFCGIVALLRYHFGRLRLYIGAAKFPGPRAFPVIGNAHYFIGNSFDIADKFLRLVKSYASPFRIWLGHRLVIIVSEPEQLKTILCSPYSVEKEDLYKFFYPWVGTGLFTAPAGKWRRHRKLIVPTMRRKILESFVEVFARQSEIMTKEMRKELDGGEFDIHHYLSLCLLDTACETTMGVKMNAQKMNSRYADAVAGISEGISKRIYKIWLHPDYIFNLTKYGRDQREYLKYVHGVTYKVIQMKKSSYNNGSQGENESAHEQPAKKKAFLDLLLDLSHNNMELTETELREEVDTMMFASSHTSAMLSMIAMAMLANNLELQDRAYRELCDIYGDQVSSETPVISEDLHRLEYLERVIKESLRLFPIFPVIARQITEDLNIGEYTLPKGASVLLALIHIHRSEKYWPDPLKFDPDRFLPEEVAKRHRYCHLPFSAGPRNCIGMNYAMMVTKVLLATVLRRYVLKKNNILDVKDIKFKADFVQSVETITLRISERVNESIKK